VGPLSALVVRLKCSLHRSPFAHNIIRTAEKRAICPSASLPYIHAYRHKLIMKGRIMSRRAGGPDGCDCRASSFLQANFSIPLACHAAFLPIFDNRPVNLA
jgi:hypothetical protein